MSSNHRDGKQFNVDAWARNRRVNEELYYLLMDMRSRRESLAKTITPKEQAVIAELKDKEIK